MFNRARFWRYTNTGHRSENQDRCEVFSNSIQNEHLVVLADGMGGHKGGSLAAQAIIDTARECWAERKKYDTASHFLENLTFTAHDNILKIGIESNLDPHSTLAALLIRQNEITSIHVGDSRVIQVHQGAMVKRTIDHSLAQLAMLRGRITEDDIANHPDQNILTSSLGGEDLPEPELVTWEPTSGSCFVVCSDGFWELYVADRLPKLIQHASKRQIRHDVDRKVAERQNHDNTTLVLAKIPQAWPVSRPLAMLVLVILITSLVTAAYLFLANPGDEEPPASEPIVVSATYAEQRIAKDDKEPALIASLEAEEKPVESGEEDSSDRKGDGELDRIVEHTKIPIEDKMATQIAVTDELVKRSRIGVNDAIEIVSDGKRIGDMKIIRSVQRHKGILVIGAEQILSVKKGTAIRIDGQTARGIDIDLDPKLTYDKALEIANESSGIKAQAAGPGMLAILKRDRGYTLVWQGLIEAESGPEEIVIDASTGAILQRVSTAPSDTLPLIDSDGGMAEGPT